MLANKIQNGRKYTRVFMCVVVVCAWNILASVCELSE